LMFGEHTTTVQA